MCVFYSNLCKIIFLNSVSDRWAYESTSTNSSHSRSPSHNCSFSPNGILYTPYGPSSVLLHIRLAIRYDPTVAAGFMGNDVQPLQPSSGGFKHGNLRFQPHGRSFSCSRQTRICASSRLEVRRGAGRGQPEDECWREI